MTSTKQGYCAIWTECISGRAGNDITSAFIQILKKVGNNHPNVTKIKNVGPTVVFPETGTPTFFRQFLNFIYTRVNR